MEEFMPIQKQPYDMLLALIEQLKHPIDEIFAIVLRLSVSCISQAFDFSSHPLEAALIL